MDWGPIIAGAVAGLGSGAAASLGAPWVQHAVETRRAKIERRRALIDGWRDMIARNYSPGYGDKGVLEDLAYPKLRGHLRDEVRRELEDPRTVIVGPDSPGIAESPVLATLSEEIDRIEREWKLV